MQELVHGGDIYSQTGAVLDFSANINPLGVPESVKRAVIDSADQWVRYPDPLCRKLRGALSSEEKVPPEWILCGNGAADVIFRVVAALRPQKALIPQPTFAEYEQALRTFSCETAFYFLTEENDFCLTESFLERLTPEIDLVFLCNPNNPTGQTIPADLLQKILERCQKYSIFLIVDECFQDFLNPEQQGSLVPQLQDFSNLLILKAFTKIYAIPGLRLGYGLSSNRECLHRAWECGQPWSVSIAAQEAGVAALKEKEYLVRTALLIQKERDFLKREFAKLGLCVIGSHANYVFFRAGQVHNLKERLLKRHILIRSCGNYRGLDASYYRVAVRTHRENEALLHALQKELFHGERG